MVIICDCGGWCPLLCVLYYLHLPYPELLLLLNILWRSHWKRNPHKPIYVCRRESTTRSAAALPCLVPSPILGMQPSRGDSDVNEFMSYFATTTAFPGVHVLVLVPVPAQPLVKFHCTFPCRTKGRRDEWKQYLPVLLFVHLLAVACQSCTPPGAHFRSLSRSLSLSRCPWLHSPGLDAMMHQFVICHYCFNSFRAESGADNDVRRRRGQTRRQPKKNHRRGVVGIAQGHESTAKRFFAGWLENDEKVEWVEEEDVLHDNRCIMS